MIVFSGGRGAHEVSGPTSWLPRTAPAQPGVLGPFAVRRVLTREASSTASMRAVQIRSRPGPPDASSHWFPRSGSTQVSGVVVRFFVKKLAGETRRSPSGSTGLRGGSFDPARRDLAEYLPR